MTFTCVRIDGEPYVLCDSPDFAIRGEHSAMDVLSACAEHSTQRILVEERCLPDEFFDLKTRVAGLFLQKLTNYHCVCAFVVELENIESERFHDLIREANRGHQFRFFGHKADAEAWLVAV